MVLYVAELLFLWFAEDKGQVALAAVVTVFVGSHEDASAAVLTGALATKTVNLAVLVNLERNTRDY